MTKICDPHSVLSTYSVCYICYSHVISVITVKFVTLNSGQIIAIFVKFAVFVSVRVLISATGRLKLSLC